MDVISSQTPRDPVVFEPTTSTEEAANKFPTCVLCGVVALEEETLQAHAQDVHDGTSERNGCLLCLTCPYKSRSRDEMSRHLDICRARPPRPQPCSVCERVFESTKA